MSVLLTPCAIASVMTGSVIKTDTKIGTIEDPNHSRAIRINDTTGVDLISVIQGEIAEAMVFEIPDMIPNMADRINEIPKAATPLVHVATIFFIKRVSRRIIKKSCTTDTGSGKIKGELIDSAAILQRKTRRIVELNPAATSFFVISSKNLLQVVYRQWLLAQTLEIQSVSFLFQNGYQWR